MGPEERGRANGFLGSSGFVGVIVSVLVLGWMLGVPGLGWRWGFYVLGGASVLSGVIIAIFVKEPPRGAAEPELAGSITEADDAPLSHPAPPMSEKFCASRPCG